MKTNAAFFISCALFFWVFTFGYCSPEVVVENPKISGLSIELFLVYQQPDPALSHAQCRSAENARVMFRVKNSGSAKVDVDSNDLLLGDFAIYNEHGVELGAPPGADSSKAYKDLWKIGLNGGKTFDTVINPFAYCTFVFLKKEGKYTLKHKQFKGLEMVFAINSKGDLFLDGGKEKK
jgi:hypothetical protein